MYTTLVIFTEVIKQYYLYPRKCAALSLCENLRISKSRVYWEFANKKILLFKQRFSAYLQQFVNSFQVCSSVVF